MTCTAQSRMTLEEQLAKAEDCVKFDEVYYKLLGEDSTYHLFQQVFNSFAFKLFVYISASHLQKHHQQISTNPTSFTPFSFAHPGRWTRSYATVPCIANPKVKPGAIPIFSMRALKVVGNVAVTRKWVNLH